MPFRCGEPCKTGKACRQIVKTASSVCHIHANPCPCCFEPIKRIGEVVTPCNHKFHWNCLTTWTLNQVGKTKTCPTCRGPLAEAWQWPKVIDIDGIIVHKILNATQLDAYLDLESRMNEITTEFYDVQMYVVIATLTKKPLPNDKCYISKDGKTFVYEIECGKDLQNNIRMRVPVEFLPFFDLETFLRAFFVELKELKGVRDNVQ